MEEGEDSAQTRTVSLSSPRSPWCGFGFFLGLLRRMGCFFGCFGVEDDERPHVHLESDPVSSKERDPLLPRNKLGSLLLSEEKESSPCKDTGGHTLASALLSGDGEVRELRDEVTPEIWKASEKVKDSPHCDGGTEPSGFYSWLPSSSVEKFQLGEQPDQDSIYPVNLCEDLGKELGSAEYKPSSMSKGEMEEKNSTKEGSEFESPDSETRNPVPATGNKKLCSVIPEAPTVDIRSKRRSVRFEFESEVESLPSNSDMLKQSDVPGGHNGSNCSPYPTPLRITDEMQTPGTIYLANVKKARIRSQYVYPVLNPVEDLSQWKELNEEDGNAYLEYGQEGESFDKCGPANPQCGSISFSNMSEMLHEGAAIVSEDLKLDASLVHWLKPSSSPEKDSNQNSGAWSISSGKSPKMSNDRPILGMVAAHWNDDGLSHDSPKCQDVNGIPNTTRKYKEDQRVNWHATPFEERLQRALSEESNVFQRKLVSERPIIFEENEETDSAGSGLNTSTQPESVVSF